MPSHKRRAHPFELGRRNMPGQNQPFGAAANPTMQGPNLHLAGARLRNRLGPDFGMLGTDIPQRFSAFDRALLRSLGLSVVRRVYPEQRTTQGGSSVMLDRVTAVSAVVEAVHRRARAPPGALRGAGGRHHCRGAVACGDRRPADSAGGLAFLLLFTITLPWSVVGFWNAVIGFLLMRFSEIPPLRSILWRPPSAATSRSSPRRRS